jgi:tRNA(adenine34) deaminase
MTISTQSHDDWMSLALAEAQRALPRDVPVGAVLVYQGELLAQACNQREAENNPVGHAEILTLQIAADRLGQWRLKDTILYVTLEPCPMCASAIMQARVGQVVFGAYDPILGACGSRYGLLTSTPELPVLGGIQEEACAHLLRTFFREARER